MLKTIVKREFKIFLQGRFSSGIILILVPLIFVLLFGAVYLPNNVKHISMVIDDEDQSSLSRALIQAYNDSDNFSIVDYASDQEEWEEKMNSGEVLSGIVIPKDFSKNIKNGDGTSVLMAVNSTNNIFSSLTLVSAAEINRTFGLGVAQQLMEAAGLAPEAALSAVSPVLIGVRILHNPTNGYVPFTLSGILLNGLNVGLLLTAAPMIIRELHKPRYKDCSPLSIIAGKSVPCWCTAMVSYILSLLVMVMIFPISCRGNIIDILLLGGAYVFFLTEVLFFFSSCSPNAVFSLQLPLLYIMPGLLFSGITWPSIAMNSFAHFFSSIIPLGYAADNFRDLLISGYAPHLWQGIGSMVAAGCLTGAAAVCIFSVRRKKQHVHMENH